MFTEKFSNIQNYQLGNGKFDGANFTPFSNAPKVFLLRAPFRILFVESAKLIFLPQLTFPFSWCVLKEELNLKEHYSANENLISIIGDNILTIQINQTTQCCLTIYNQDMKILDSTSCKLDDTQIGTFVRQIGNYIIVTTNLREILYNECDPCSSISEAQMKNPQSISILDKYRHIHTCNTFIFNIKDNIINKKEFIGYAILQECYFNLSRITIDDIIVLENPLTKQSIILSLTENKYHEVNGFCRHFNKNENYFIFGIANLDYMLLPFGTIDNFIYIPRNIQEDTETKFEVKLIDNHLEFSASHLCYSYMCHISSLPKNMTFIKTFMQLKEFITDAINNVSDIISFSYTIDKDTIIVNIEYKCKYIQESVEYKLLLLPTDELSIIRKRLENLESKIPRCTKISNHMSNKHRKIIKTVNKIEN